MRGPWASGTRARRARSRRSGSGGGEKGVSARAVGSLACPGLAGILFWSRGRVERRGREVEALGREAELRAHSGKEGVRWS